MGKSSKKGIKKKQLNFIATVREKWTLQDLLCVCVREEVCVCACVRERERERECVCEGGCVCMSGERSGEESEEY